MPLVALRVGWITCRPVAAGASGGGGGAAGATGGSGGSGGTGGTTGGSAANAKSLGGAWRAWLSTSSGPLGSTFTKSTLSYRLFDGTAVANKWNDLVDGSLANAINLTGTGATIANGEVWTHTFTSAQKYSGSGCSGFGSSARNQTAVVGLTGSKFSNAATEPPFANGVFEYHAFFKILDPANWEQTGNVSFDGAAVVLDGTGSGGSLRQKSQQWGPGFALAYDDTAFNWKGGNVPVAVG